MEFTSRPRYDASQQPSLSLSHEYAHDQTQDQIKSWQREKAMRVMLAYLRNLTQAIVRKEQPAGMLPPELANLRVMGMQVAATRAGQPRCHATRFALPFKPARQNSLAGNAAAYPADYSLGYLLAYLASSLAAGGANDPRLSPAELAYLGMELTVFHQPQWVAQRAEDRIACVLPLEHGLVLDHPQGRAMLLPQTDEAMAQAEDASRLLDRVSVAAGLGPDAWRRDPQAQLLLFHIRQIQSEPSLGELGSLSLSGHRVQQLMDVIHATAYENENANTSSVGDDVLTKISPMFMALSVTTAADGHVWAGGKAKTLLSLAHAIGHQLRKPSSQASPGASDPLVRLTAHWRPTLLLPADPHAQRHLVTAATLHLQSPKGSQLVPGGSLNLAQIKAWREGCLEVTALSSRIYEQRLRKNPKQKH